MLRIRDRSAVITREQNVHAWVRQGGWVSGGWCQRSNGHGTAGGSESQAIGVNGLRQPLHAVQPAVHQRKALHVDAGALVPVLAKGLRQRIAAGGPLRKARARHRISLRLTGGAKAWGRMLVQWAGQPSVGLRWKGEGWAQPAPL